MSEPVYYLCPYRFSADPRAMIKFYETLGLVTEVGTESETFAILRGHGGRIGVHDIDTAADASTVSTEMCFETPDADTAAAHCRRLGLDATVVDEAYGRHVDVRHGDRFVTVNEEMSDFYGYRQRREDAHPTAEVVAVWFCHDFDAEAQWYANFGFRSDDHDNHWRELRSASPAGTIGLHAIDDQAPGHVSIALASSEPLETVIQRLHDNGYTDASIVNKGIVNIEVTDPDGCTTEIHKLHEAESQLDRPALRPSDGALRTMSRLSGFGSGATPKAH